MEVVFMKKILVSTIAALSLASFSTQVSATEQSVETSGVEDTNSIQMQSEMTPSETEIFPVEEAITYAENFANNENLVFSNTGEVHIDPNGNIYYQLRAQNKEWIKNGEVALLDSLTCTQLEKLKRYRVNKK